MATTINYSFEKQDFGHPVRDDELGANLDLIDTAIASCPQAATFIVAASDSVHKQRADYICDGVNDQVEIQAGLDALPSGGGKIVLLEGTFDFSSQVSRAIDKVTIEGMGKSTLINLNASTPVISAGSQSNWVFKNFATDNGWIAISSAQKVRVKSIFRGNELPIDDTVIAPYYLIAKDGITGYYFVKKGLTGEIEKVVTDSNHAEIAFQYAIDNAPAGAAIGVNSIGIGDTYWISDTININKCIAIESFKRHGVRIRVVDGVDCGAIITSDYTTTVRCSQLSGLSLIGNDQVIHGVHIINVPSSSGFRLYDIYNEDIKGYGVLYAATTGECEIRGGFIRGSTGAVKCSTEPLRVSSAVLYNTGSGATKCVEIPYGTITDCWIVQNAGANRTAIKTTAGVAVSGCWFKIDGDYAGTKVFDVPAGKLYCSSANIYQGNWKENIGDHVIDLSAISGRYIGETRNNDGSAGSIGPYWWNGSAWCKMDDWTQTITP